MADRPNIILITSDQHRWDSLGCADHPCVRTPHLDQLAFEGVRFANAYSDCPVCIPARTTLITGVKSSTYGCPYYGEDFRLDRDRSQYLGSLMTAAGYQTALVGKRHWHTADDFRAGFETVIPTERCTRQQLLHLGRDGWPFGVGANELSPTLSPLPPELHSTDWIVDRCIELIREREKGQPFFLWCSMDDPHPPLAIHEPYYSMYDDSPIPDLAIGTWEDSDDCPSQQFGHRTAYNSKPMGADELRKARAVYYGMITNIDHQLGRLFGYLMNQGLWDDVWIIYTTDHGEHLGDHYDVAKSSFYNSAARLPFIVRPPRSLQSEDGGWVSDAMVELADLLPTFCKLANADVPDDVEGMDLSALIAGQVPIVRERLFGAIDDQHMVHDGKYKYLYFVADGREQLFDHAADPNDLTNIAAANPETVAKLRQALIDRLQAINSPDVTDGQLRNDGHTDKNAQELRRYTPLGWGGMGQTLE
jgi:arylsulfatase A-like enzyme